MITEVLINGESSDGRIPVTDSSVLRGDGCFEVLRSYGGDPFALEEHVDRLERSAAALGIELPPRDALEAWIVRASTEVGDGAVRVVVTRGAAVPGLNDPSSVIVFGHQAERSQEPARLLPVAAPWHSAGAAWDLSGAKVLSYAPNLAASRRAQTEGFDDALLLGDENIVLEGPTFSVGWVVDDVLETPGLDLGILDSITRRIVLDLASGLGIEIMEGKWDLGRLDDAVEVMAWSTIREVQAVTRIGDRSWQPGAITERLSGVFAELVG